MNMVITGGIAVGGTSRAASKWRDVLWAWLSLVVLVLCWDAAARLDDTSSPSRRARMEEGAEGREIQKALMPVSARPTVN